jgi:hypothetical protein
MSTTTTTLGLTKPALSAGDVWGDDINDNFDTIDTFAADTNTALDARAALSHTHVASAVTDFSEAVDDRVNTLLTAGSNITLDYNDSVNTLTISASGGGGGGATEYDTLSDVGAATISADIQAVRTSGYTTLGDGGNGLYVRLDAAPSDPTNNAYIRSVDRYTLSGSTDATHGGYWVLVPEGGEVRIEQFGGRGNWDGATGTDNYQPLLDAIAFYARNPWSEGFPSFRIVFSGGAYKFSTTVEIHQPVWLLGLGQGNDQMGNGEPTALVFPANTTCFIFQSRFTYGATGENDFGLIGSSSGSCIEGFEIRQLGTPSDTTAHGILMRSSVAIKKCTFFNIAGDAIKIRAGTSFGGGNANRWLVQDTQIHDCLGHGLYIVGTDVNAGNAYNFYTRECGKCGICDTSGLGNNYHGLEIDGYGNSGVHYGGYYWQQISTAVGIGNTPGTNQWAWYNRGARPDASLDSIFPAYNALYDYTVADLALPIFVEGTSNRSTISGLYVEEGAVWSHCGGSPSVVTGPGQSRWTNKSCVLGGGGTSSVPLNVPTGFSAEKTFAVGDPGYTTYGTFVNSAIGGTASSGGGDDNAGIDLQVFESATDGFCYAKFSSHDITWQWFNQAVIYGWTGEKTTKTFGRLGPTPYKFFATDIGLVDATDSSRQRLMGVRAAVPTEAGAFSVGERYYHANPTAGGFEGWVCTTAGAIGGPAWVTATGYSALSIVTASAGRIYQNIGAYGTSSVEPVHVSGNVTDGTIIWAYLGNSAPVFKEFGAIKGTSAYTPTNVSADRGFDANATTTDELADVLGTLIADLQAAGVLA